MIVHEIVGSALRGEISLLGKDIPSLTLVMEMRDCVHKRRLRSLAAAIPRIRV